MNNPLRFIGNYQQIRRFHLTSVHLRGRFKYYRVDKPCPDPKYQAKDYFENEGLKVDLLSPDYIEKLGAIWFNKQEYKHELLRKSGR